MMRRKRAECTDDKDKIDWKIYFKNKLLKYIVLCIFLELDCN